MRYRTRDRRSTTYGTLRTENLVKAACNSTLPTWIKNWEGTYAVKSGSYFSMADAVVKGYNKRSQRGEVFFNPMRSASYTIDAGYGGGGALMRPSSQTCSAPNSYYMDFRTIQSGVSESRIVMPTSNLELDFNGQVVVPTSIVSNDDIRKLHVESSTQCLADRGTSDSNQWEAVAELNKSLAMASQAASQIEEFTRKKGALLKKAKAASNLYLLYRYGLTPLMASLQTATEGMLKAEGKIRQTSRGSASTSKTVTSSTTASPYGAYRLDVLVTTTETYKVRTTSLDEMFASMANNIGFTSKGLMQLPWELLPYSFVVDWFANIGDVYAASLPTFGLNGLGSCTVVERNIVRRVDQVGSAVSLSGYSIQTQPIPTGYSCQWTEKTRNPGLSNPGLVIRSDFKFDSEHKLRILDALSLVTQRLK